MFMCILNGSFSAEKKSDVSRETEIKNYSFNNGKFRFDALLFYADEMRL